MFFFWLKFESKVCERIFWFVRYSDSPLSLWFSFCYYLRLWISLKLNWFQVNETIADSFGNSFTSFIQSLSLLFHLDLDSFFRFLCCCCYKITSLVGIFFWFGPNSTMFFLSQSSSLSVKRFILYFHYSLDSVSFFWILVYMLFAKVYLTWFTI